MRRVLARNLSCAGGLAAIPEREQKGELAPREVALRGKGQKTSRPLNCGREGTPTCAVTTQKTLGGGTDSHYAAIMAYFPFFELLVVLLALLVVLLPVVFALLLLRTVNRMSASLRDIADHVKTVSRIADSVSFPEILVLLRDIADRVASLEQAVRDTSTRRAT